MAHSHSLRRAAAALGATGLAALLLAAPASARQDPGTGGPDPAPPTRVITVPGRLVDDGIELVQVGLGAVGGAALLAAGAGAVATSRRRHPHPA